MYTCRPHVCIHTHAFTHSYSRSHAHSCTHNYKIPGYTITNHNFDANVVANLIDDTVDFQMVNLPPPNMSVDTGHSMLNPVIYTRLPTSAV